MKNSKKILAIVMFGYTVLFMDKQLIALAIVPISEEFSLNAVQMGNIMAFYFVGYSLMQIPSGILADKFGPKKVLLLSLGLAGISSFFFSSISVVGLFVSLRLVLGIAHAGYPSGATKTISTTFEPSKRVFAQSMILSTAGLGGILAATIGALLLSVGWRFAYTALGALYLVALLVVLFFIPRNNPIQESTTTNVTLDWSTILKDANVYILFVSLLFVNIVLYGVMSWIPKYLVDVLQASSTDVSLVVAFNAILTVSSTIVTGLLLSKAWKGKEKTIITMALIATAIFLPSFVLVKSFALAILLLALLTIASVAAFTTLFTMPHKVFDTKVIGITFGIVSTGGTLGGFISNIIIGNLVQESGGYLGSFIFMAIIAILCIMVSRLLKKRQELA